MIYEQQKQVSTQLYHVEQKVRELKHETTQLIYRKNPDLTSQDVEQILTRFDTKDSINETLKTAQVKHESVLLAKSLGQKLAIDIQSREDAKTKLFSNIGMMEQDDMNIGMKRSGPSDMYSTEPHVYRAGI